MPSLQDLPDYEPLLQAFHAAFEAELRRMVDGLPIPEGGSVLELACGDGAYTPWLAAKVGPSGRVVASDASLAYAAMAWRAGKRDALAGRMRFAVAEIERLPFDDDAFDFAWCAQSLYSLPDPLQAIRAMARVVRPGGSVAVLENDTIHQIVLPWPPDLELAIRAAEMAGLAEEFSNASKFYVGRNLNGLFLEAGLVDVELRSSAASRTAPLDAPARLFLTAYLDDLRGRVAERLSPSERSRAERLFDHESDEGIVNRPDLSFTCLDHVVIGVKPSPSASGSTTRP